MDKPKTIKYCFCGKFAGVTDIMNNPWPDKPDLCDEHYRLMVKVRDVKNNEQVRLQCSGVAK
jgi:hypothetical protein